MCVTGCSKIYENPIVIWTNQIEFVAYAELFNATQDNAKIVVVYKENPVEDFPPTKNEDLPDIVVGPWLKNERIHGNFMPVDYMFEDQLISRTQFYPQLLKLGNVNNKQYLLPVSFNLSTVIFSTDYSEFIPDNYMLNPDQIRDAGAMFNEVEDGVYTSMGFAPLWEPEFLYEMTKLSGTNFSESGGNTDTFSWDQVALDTAIAYMRDWTSTINTSTEAEKEYQFIYLHNPPVKRITEKNCLFTYMTSNTLFSTPAEKLEGIDFRWIQKDNAIPIQDDMISMGIYKYSKNLAAAERFVIWFMNEENQKAMLQWRNDMNLYTSTFGISSGFSAIRSVNERVFPTFYPTLLGNLPAAEFLSPPNRLPGTWFAIQENIITPYLLDAIDTQNTDSIQTISQRLAEWNRLNY